MDEKFVKLSWSDTTAVKSYIERLNFDADHKWTKAEIEITGTKRETT